VPPRALAELVPAASRAGETWFDRLTQLSPSPIVSVHLWLDRLVMHQELIGLIDRPLHWIFNRNRIATVTDPSRSHLSLTVSAARALVDRAPDEIVALAVDEVRRALPAARGAQLVHARVWKEREATIAHPAGGESLRPGCVTPIDGLFAAGDWVRTGLPATVESAARAGEEAARLALAWDAPPAERPLHNPPPSGAFVSVSRLRKPA
jgi:uncharacterized protein with NAD-binding domain and iron-sulfur cluster